MIITYCSHLFYFQKRRFLIIENEKNITTDTNIVGTEGATHSDPTSVVSRTIGKTTYVANLHFKEQGQTFSQKLKRVLKADAGC